MFEGFQLARMEIGNVTLRVRYGGRGAPAMLLHGSPGTHLIWHR